MQYAIIILLGIIVSFNLFGLVHIIKFPYKWYKSEIYFMLFCLLMFGFILMHSLTILFN